MIREYPWFCCKTKGNASARVGREAFVRCALRRPRADWHEPAAGCEYFGVSARAFSTRLPRPGRAALVALTVLGAACDVDRLFEGPVPVVVKLAVTLESNVVTVAPGNTATVGASITRIGEYRGEVIFKLSGVPDGVIAEIGAPATSGQVTTTTLTFRVGGTVAAGSYIVTVHGSGGANGGAAAAEVELRVAPVPAIALLPAKSSVTIIRGGIAPVRVAITRTAFPDPVTLSLTGAAGISATVAGGASSGASADITIAVAAGVVPGTYPMTLRGSGTGIVDHEVPMTVVVSPDPLQVLVGDPVTPQASLVTASVIVNRFGVSGPVVLSVDGLPQGVTATFTDGATATTATASFAVNAGVAPGAYILTLRGRSAGVSDATSPFVLTVGPSNVSVTLVPQSVTVLQGAAAASTLTLIRTSYDGSVAVQVLGVPDGISVVATEAIVTGNTTFLTVTTDRALAPGVYTVTVRAVPSPLGGAGTPALDPVTSTLTITVLPAPTGTGNVVLDWSGCAEPQWVAAQDGTGPWTRLTGAQGIFRFTVTAGRGGFAYSEGGTELTVRYATSAELAAGPVSLCPAPAPLTRTVTGTAQHSGALEQFTWRIGGGAGLSTLAAPNFSITGVREGTHDLIGWGVSQVQGQRAHFTRDVSVTTTGASVGTVSLIGERSFTPQSANVNVSGFTSESRTLTMSYLSDAACTANELYTQSGAAFSGTLFNTLPGIPGVWQRPDDYHRLDVVASTASGLRTVSVSFHSMVARGVALPPAVFPGVVAIAGTYKRLRVSVGAGIPAMYNGSLTLRYSAGGRAMTVSATVAALGGGTPLLDMPELGSVEGFPLSAIVPLGATGTWSLVLDGSTGTPLCSEESGRWSVTRNGVF